VKKMSEQKPDKAVKVLLITGMSGAGKSQAIAALEDLGYFCVDNLPPNLLLKFIEGLILSKGNITKVAFVVDIRGEIFFPQLADNLNQLKVITDCQVIYLEASNEALVRRYKETRRRHPLAGESETVLESIITERKKMEEIRGCADLIIDTSDLSPRQLNEYMVGNFSSAEAIKEELSVSIISFGYKYGLPIDADLLMDVRFLPNPYYDLKMRPLTGLEKKVRDFVLKSDPTREFLRRYTALLRFLMPNYLNEGKKHLSIAIGCTGGRHRSVVIAENIAKRLKAEGYHINLSHRDIKKADPKA